MVLCSPFSYRVSTTYPSIYRYAGMVAVEEFHVHGNRPTDETRRRVSSFFALRDVAGAPRSLHSSHPPPSTRRDASFPSRILPRRSCRPCRTLREAFLVPPPIRVHVPRVSRWIRLSCSRFAGALVSCPIQMTSGGRPALGSGGMPRRSCKGPFRGPRRGISPRGARGVGLLAGATEVPIRSQSVRCVGRSIRSIRSMRENQDHRKHDAGSSRRNADHVVHTDTRRIVLAKATARRRKENHEQQNNFCEDDNAWDLDH